MLTAEIIERAIEMLEVGDTQAQVAAMARISLNEAKAVADALYRGEPDRLFREVALAGLLEAAAQALRSGRGLIGDGAGDVVREIWHCYPNARLKGCEVDDRD